MFGKLFKRNSYQKVDQNIDKTFQVDIDKTKDGKYTLTITQIDPPTTRKPVVYKDNHQITLGTEEEGYKLFTGEQLTLTQKPFVEISRYSKRKLVFQ